MDYSYTKSGNIIAKSAEIKGPQYIVNKGLSFVGKEAVVHGDRNNGKPVISWGKYVIIDDRCCIKPADLHGTFYPMIIGENVYFGVNSTVSAASVGSNVIVGENAEIGEFAVLRDGACVPPNTKVPKYAVVGPLAMPDGTELPESAPHEIHRFCKLKLNGIQAQVPFVE